MAFSFFSDLAKQIHEANAKWWADPKTGQRINRDKRQLLFLIVSELAECGEGERKDKMDDHLPHRKNAEVEMADAFIRLLDYIGAFKYNIGTRMLATWDTTLNPGKLNFFDLTNFFRGRFFRPADNPAVMLFYIIQAVMKVGDLEDAGSPARDIEAALVWLLSLIFDYCGQREFNLGAAVNEKMEFNARRLDHTHEARLAAGGKKW